MSTQYRLDYPHIVPIQTRWTDNDIFGHVNNVIYYSYFDTIVNNYLIEVGGFDIQNASVIGLAVETHCEFLKPVAYPEKLEAGLRVGHLGTSSVRFEIAIFRQGIDIATAYGHFVHVFVERKSNKSVPIPLLIRAALELLMVA